MAAPTFSSSVSYVLSGSALDLADNDFRLIEQNGTLNQWATLELTDMYPSANFTFGFELTATEGPGATYIPFVVMFYDTQTRLKFILNSNGSQTNFSVVMENDVEGTTQTYPLYSGTKPTLYLASNKKFLIRLLNGFLWVKVGATYWLTKLDVQAHPLHLEGGIIQLSLTNTTVLVSHSIKNLYFEPILCINDSAYFAKSVFSERYENLDASDIAPFSFVGGNVGVGSTQPTQKLDVGDNINASQYYKNGSILSLKPQDLKVGYEAGVVAFSYVGIPYIDDPLWKPINQPLIRSENVQLANALGIPTSQYEFIPPYPDGFFKNITATDGVFTNITATTSVATAGVSTTSLLATGIGYIEESECNNLTVYAQIQTPNLTVGTYAQFNGDVVVVGRLTAKPSYIWNDSEIMFSPPTSQ